MIPENLKVPHIETNEDGKQSEYPGYIEIKCQRCGKYFIVAKNASVSFCGDPKCGKELK